MTTKGILIVYPEWVQAFNELNDQQAGQLFRLLLARAGGSLNAADLEAADLGVRVAFRFCAASIQRNEEKYAKTVRSRAQAGRKGGLARAEKQAALDAQAEQAELDAQDEQAAQDEPNAQAKQNNPATADAPTDQNAPNPPARADAPSTPAQPSAPTNQPDPPPSGRKFKQTKQSQANQANTNSNSNTNTNSSTLPPPVVAQQEVVGVVCPNLPKRDPAPTDRGFCQVELCYGETMSAPMPRSVRREVQRLLAAGTQAQLICEALRIACNNNVPKWSYAQAVLRRCEKNGITTAIALRGNAPPPSGTPAKKYASPDPFDPKQMRATLTEELGFTF